MNNKKLFRGNASDSVMLVEGNDDKHVLYSLLEHYQVPQIFNIEDKEGIDKLLESFEIELKGSRLERLGIMLDADINLIGRWQRLQNILRNASYTSIPSNPDPDGTIISEEGRPTVGIWLMPNNTLPGMLEDFISFLIPSDDQLWPVAINIVQMVKAMGSDRCFRNALESKAKIHTGLAWQEEPGKPMGQAITATYLNANAAYAQQLVHWIQKLFDVEIV